MSELFHQPLSPWRLWWAKFSVTDSAIYVKLALGMWLGFAPFYLLGNHDAAGAMASSTMLTLALGGSNSSARSYFLQRVTSNVVAMPICTALIWFTAPRLWLGVLLIPVVTFSIVHMKPSWFRLTSITVPMTLVLYNVGLVGAMEDRLLGVVLGMWLGFVIQQFVLPPDHGYLANTLVNEGNRTALNGLSRFAHGKLSREEISPLTEQLQKIRTRLDQTRAAFQLDLQQSWISQHLRRNKARLPLFALHCRAFEVLVRFFEALEHHHAEYLMQSNPWRAAFGTLLIEQCNVYGRLSHAADLRAHASAPLTDYSYQRNQLESLLRSVPAHDAVSDLLLGRMAEFGLLMCRIGDMYEPTDPVVNGDLKLTQISFDQRFKTDTPPSSGFAFNRWWPLF